MLIAASDENLDLAAEYGALAVETPNRPLGRKCNVALKRAAQEGADWIVWIGSDDWVHPDVFDPLPYQDTDVPAIQYGHRLAIVDLRTGLLRLCESPSKYGAIPWIVPRRMLERSRFEPVAPTLNRGLDGALVRGIRLSRAELRWRPHNPHGLRCVDFKTDTNITPYERLAIHGVRPEESAWPVLAERFDTDLVDMARDVHEQMKGAWNAEGYEPGHR